eukprot:4910325-Lingulodinium_polyedra.AAC.1
MSLCITCTTPSAGTQGGSRAAARGSPSSCEGSCSRTARSQHTRALEGLAGRGGALSIRNGQAVGTQPCE